MRADTVQSYQDRIRRVLLHIENHLDEPLPLEDLARVACLSPYHFHRVFRGMVGEAVKEHVRRLRLERAAQRLLQCDSSILDIALDAGYETHESFTRAFLAMFGTVPSGFRENGGKGMKSAAVEMNHSPVAVEIRRMEAMKIAYVRHVGPYAGVGAAWQRLCGWAGPKGLLGPGTLFLGLSHDDPEITPPERLRYDAAITVSPRIEGEGEIGVQELAGGDYAVYLHKGPHERLGEAYAKLCGQWLPSSGRELRNAPPVEIYRTMPGRVPPEEMVTEICLPLEAAGR